MERSDMMEGPRTYYVQEMELRGLGSRVVWTSEAMTWIEAKAERMRLTQNRNGAGTWFTIIQWKRSGE